MTLKNYDEFVSFMDEAGIMTLWSAMPGVARLHDFTQKAQWFTGDPETDPWMWKDRAAGERTLAFSGMINGSKGFASRSAFPYLYAAYQPADSLEDRYESGALSQLIWKTAGLFADSRQVSVSDVRKELGLTDKRGAGQANRALHALQAELYITGCGTKQRISMEGLPYGWPANAYALTEDYLADWLPESLPGVANARERVIDMCHRVTKFTDRIATEKALFG